MPTTFLVKLRGVSFPNDDGTSRQELIRRCRAAERLNLRADPSNVHDRNAVSAFNAAGHQLGWLPSDARDAASILRGEQVDAIVEKQIGGPGLIDRLLRRERSFGLVVRITKSDINWKQFDSLRRKAEVCDKLVEAGNRLEKACAPTQAIDLYYQGLNAIIQLNSSDPQASAHRYKAAPVNRLTLLLDRAGRWQEAIAAIDLWRSATDPVGLPTAELLAVTKREERLREKLAATP